MSVTHDWAIEVEDLTVAYGSNTVLWDIDLGVPVGQKMAIVGPNGAGKSTLIKAMLGLVPSVAGRVRVLGREIDSKRDLKRALEQIAYVPQRSLLDWDFPTDVLDMVTMGTYHQLGWLRRPGAAQRDQAMHALEKVGIAPLAQRPIGELSGGQKQRVLLARALVQQAPIYVLDEPLQGVDAPTEQALAEVIHELREEGKTILVVHHDLQTIEEYFDWVVLLNVEAVASGPVATTFTEENLRRAFRGRVGISPVRV